MYGHWQADYIEKLKIKKHSLNINFIHDDSLRTFETLGPKNRLRKWMPSLMILRFFNELFKHWSKHIGWQSWWIILDHLSQLFKWCFPGFVWEFPS